MSRLAWFSPMPPVPSGVASCSAQLVEALGPPYEYEIEVFVDASRTPPPPGTRSAHDFLWRHRQNPYDLTVYQLGNSSVHNYIWPYLFRYPGLAVLHDGHLHHARAAQLLHGKRAADYRVEFAANHPAVTADLAELAVAGFDSHLHYYWPMRRLIVETSKLTVVHSERLADELRDELPGASIEAIRLGHGRLVTPAEAAAARQEVRARRGIPADALVFGVFGGLSPDKRVPQILAAFAATRHQLPASYLLLAGGIPSHYDPGPQIRQSGLAAHVIATGHLESEEELTAHIAASDIAFNLRWPTAREVSGPWLRCLAAGRPTVIFQLAHLGVLPSLDPRTWRMEAAGGGSNARPICVAIDLLDEDHSLRLVMRRLAQDFALRDALGRAARDYWRANHDPALMIEDYRRVITRALALPAPRPQLPPHLLRDATSTLHDVLTAFGVADPLR
jgi:glycosyltransferase involved in cell wall biosynthesis